MLQWFSNLPTESINSFKDLADSFIKAYQDALDSSHRPVKAVLFCNPHNPRGDLCPRQRIEALLQFCHRNNLHFVSDEIYGLSTFDSKVTFTSVLQLDLAALRVDPGLVHFIYSISKDQRYRKCKAAS